jgi:hypothetical protein
MLRILSGLVTMSLFAVFGPAAGAHEGDPPIDCGPADGRERFTAQGFEMTFDAPDVAAPELAATTGVTGNLITPHRSAHFYFQADLTPYVSGMLKVALDWENPSDFDVYHFDADGNRTGSDASNIDGGTTAEAFEVEVTHCQLFSIEVRNWAGKPDESLKLSMTVVPGDHLLACAEADPAPGCAGKAAGEAPSPVADARPRLYLGGDPGQVSMVHAYVGNSELPKGKLSGTRPTTGTPNQYTRPVVGFRDQWQNPFLAHWKTTLEQPVHVAGEANVLLWLSSRTEDATGTLYVDLYADDALVGQAKVPGDQLKADPTPLFVSVPITEAIDATSLGLQVGTNPAIATSGPGNPADAHVTLYYGSVQYPARITLAA